MSGGKSSSSSNPVTMESSVVGGDESTNVSQIVNGSGNTITDHGAVNAAVELAKQGIVSVSEQSRAVTAAAGDMLSGTLGVVGAQQKQFTETLEKVKTSDVRILAGVGVVVVGLAAVALFNRKG